MEEQNKHTQRKISGMHPPQGTVIFADNKLFSFLRYRSCQNNISTFPFRFAARSLHTSHRAFLSFCVCCDVRFPFLLLLFVVVVAVVVFIFSLFLSLFSPPCACERARCLFSSLLSFIFSRIFPVSCRFNFSFSCVLCTVTSIL